MSHRPDIVSDWHGELYKQTPVSADHCARIIRAIYRREARRDRSLPPALPTSAIEFTKYEPSQVALDFKAYPAWRKAWEALESPVHRGYHLFCLLTGCRPGEGSRIRLNDIDTDARMFVIRNAKAGKDIYLPITPEIAFAISLAVNAEVKPHHEVKETDLVFPGCRQISQRAKLPIRGQALRHSYSTVAVDLKIDDLIRHFLMGHAPKGISQDYVALLILQNGPAMREAQEQISKRIVKLLGLTLGAHHDAPLVPDAPNRVEAAGPHRLRRQARALGRATSALAGQASTGAAREAIRAAPEGHGDGMKTAAGSRSATAFTDGHGTQPQPMSLPVVKKRLHPRPRLRASLLVLVCRWPRMINSYHNYAGSEGHPLSTHFQDVHIHDVSRRWAHPAARWKPGRTQASEPGTS